MGLIINYPSPKSIVDCDINVQFSNPVMSLIQSLQGKEVHLDVNDSQHSGLVLGVETSELPVKQTGRAYTITKKFIVILNSCS